MLTNICLKDYTTFIKETIFDFHATNYKILEDTNVGDNRILKGALFVGENASGKTQVLNSIVLLLNLLLDNSDHNYLLKKSVYTKGSKFNLSFSFNIDNNDIKYEVGFDGNNIRLEKLYLNNELKLNRLNKNGQTNFGEEKENDDINSNLSLLKLEYYNTKFNNDKILNKWFDFLKNSMYINCLLGRMRTYNPSNVSEQVLTKYAEKNDEKKINKLINKIGYNSEVVFIKNTSNDDISISVDREKEMIGIVKKGTNVIMPLQLESTGNKAFLSIILPIQYAVKHDCMIIVDEFSSGLHNELEEALIRYFFENSNNSQLFFTSHSTNLLDNSILRPDQIYSFKFVPNDGTIVNRFSNENPRESQNIEKMYLNGVFDGMPEYSKKVKD